jgi:transposase-like protein
MTVFKGSICIWLKLDALTTKIKRLRQDLKGESLMTVKLTVVKPTEAVPACRYCGSNAVVKFGSYKGVQRYWRKVCKRKFKATIPCPI